MTDSDRILGCLAGGAIGDAMGGPYEGSAARVRIDDEAEWRLSDDTQLTLATCEAIAAAGRVDPAMIAAKMAEWFADGRVTGMGAASFAALRALSQGGHWALVGMRGERAAGNGAAMRIAPLAFLLDPADPASRQVIRDVSRITHHHDEAYAGAVAVLAAVRYAWKGNWREKGDSPHLPERPEGCCAQMGTVPFFPGSWSGGPDLIARIAGLLPDCRVRDRLQEILAIGHSASLSEIAQQFGVSGYVVESVPLALCGAERVQTLGFREMLQQLISAGGDTDTIASIAGQIAGTLIGYDALPAWMVERMPESSAICRYAEQLSYVVSRSGKES